ncbi:MAG TPA: RNA methyltransferase, partial [Polyangiaceae bacterium]|nr:RNA methyltransferase [Polyangiaceae bacterium]
ARSRGRPAGAEPVAATLVRVASADDPRLGAYRDVRDRELKAREGAFLAESEQVVRLLATSRLYATRSLLLAEGRVDKLGDLLAALPASVTAFVAPQAMVDALVGFPMHRGVLALGERGAPLEPAALLAAPGPATVIGLVGVNNHDNVGGAFRNAAAFGARGVLLDPASCDPLYRKAVRVSVGGALVVPFAHAAGEGELVAALERAGYEVIALSPQGAERLDALGAVGPRRALLLGAEGPGLPAPLLARLRSARVPMAEGFDSLNVAVACGIALFALAGR